MQATKPRSFPEKLERELSRMKGGDLSAERFALSAAVGLFVGAQPYYGAHIILCSLICIPLRLNSLIAYLVAWYSIPPLMPFLLYVSLEIGHRVMTGEALTLSWEHFTPSDLLNVTHELVIGACGLGLIMSAVFTPPIYLFARTFKKKETPLAPVSLKIVYDLFELYRGQKKREQYAALFRLRFSSASQNLITYLREYEQPIHRVLLVNCAQGEVAFLLARLGLARVVVGLEANCRQLASAQLASSQWGDFIESTGETDNAEVRFLSPQDHCSDSQTWDLIVLETRVRDLKHAFNQRLLESYGAQVSPQGRMIVSFTPQGIINKLGSMRPKKLPLASTSDVSSSEPWFIDMKDESDGRLCIESHKPPGFLALVTKA